VTSLAHVIVTEGLVNEAFVRERCDPAEFRDWAEFVSEERNSPEAVEKVSGVPADLIRKAARLYATGGNAAIYYGLGVTEHSQGSTTVLAIANLALATGNLGRRGVGVNPLRGQNNVQGACDMGSFPHEFAGYRHVSDETARTIYQNLWGVALDREPGLRIPNMLDAAVEGTFMGIYIQGEDILQSDPDTHHVSAGHRRAAPRMSPGTKKTVWKSMRTTPNNAASMMAIGWSSQAALGRRPCGRSSRIVSRRVSFTRRSTIRPRKPMS
jgi:formate dehydrogenase major subunit